MIHTNRRRIEFWPFFSLSLTDKNMCSLGKVSKYSSQQTVGSNTIPVPGEKGWAHVARTFHNTRNQHKHEQKHASKTQVQHQAGSKNGLGACNGHLHKGVLYELWYKSGIHWQSEKPFFVGKKKTSQKKSQVGFLWALLPSPPIFSLDAEELSRASPPSPRLSLTLQRTTPDESPLRSSEWPKHQSDWVY